MPPGTNSFEYQLTPALAECVLMEECELRLATLYKWALPSLCGLPVAALMSWWTCQHGISGSVTNVDASTAATFQFVGKLIGAAVGAVIGFGIGFFLGWRLQKGLREASKQTTLKRIEKLGYHRKIAWDEAGLMINYQDWESRIGWRHFNQAVQGKMGIHLYAQDRALISIPKQLLPPDLSPDHLVSTWSGLIKRTIPPPLK
jgi:hypothetical protein